VRAGSSPIEPGRVPATNVVLSWATFTEAADEAGLSRRDGGIHFAVGDMAGRRIGRQVGAQVWRKSLVFFVGTAASLAPVEAGSSTSTTGNLSAALARR